MNPPPIRCADCMEMWLVDVNLLDGKIIAKPPKRKRGGCQHPIGSIEAYDEDEQTWAPQGVSS